MLNKFFEELENFNCNITWGESADIEGLFLILVENNDDENFVEGLLAGMDIEELEDELGMRISIEYQDEYYLCEKCNKYTSDRYIIHDCSCYCIDCFQNDPKEFLDSFINNPSKAYPELPTKLLDSEYMNGEPFAKIDKVYYIGLYENTLNSEPSEVIKQYLDIYNEVVFYIEYANTFELSFGVIVRNV